ncbi:MULTISPECIES: hypothetical protein [Shewanella]|uniref:Uncharacterized protein n=2 Tax=Shewanella TaxID=22 RepID=A0A8A9LE53_9GAMM|nr:MULTISPECIES: hypothetical protein [Shewanella]ASK68604.1 hypothetical protein CF168_06780 [Shewanella bicestrii]QTS34887.1 hypothetical protein D0436_23680 [Shewanella decolorationis]
MRQSNRQKHLKHQHKTTQIRRKHYFHAAQQNLQLPPNASAEYSTLASLISNLKATVS